MKPLQTTDKIKITDGDTLLWYNFKNGKGVYEVDYTLARDVVSKAEIFFYKRNAMWRKSNLNKNNRVSCPYDTKSQLEKRYEELAHYNLEIAQQFKYQLEAHDEMLEQSNREKQQWKQMVHTLADHLGRMLDAGEQGNPHKAKEALKQFKKLKS